jgi:hypothetical protein
MCLVKTSDAVQYMGWCTWHKSDCTSIGMGAFVKTILLII